MKLSTNYSKADWYRYISSLCIAMIPILVAVFVVFTVFLPHIEFFAIWISFLVDNNILVDFRNYMYDDLGYEGDLLVMFFLGWVGFSSTPIICVYILTRLLPIDWIINKLKIEPRMKLVVFWNGKPLRWRFKQ